MAQMTEEPGGGDVFSHPPRPPRLVISLETGKTRFKAEIKPNSRLAKYFAIQSRDKNPPLSALLTEMSQQADSDHSDSGLGDPPPPVEPRPPTQNNPFEIPNESHFNNQHKHWHAPIDNPTYTQYQYPNGSPVTYSRSPTNQFQPYFLARRWGAPDDSQSQPHWANWPNSDFPPSTVHQGIQVEPETNHDPTRHSSREDSPSSAFISAEDDDNDNDSPLSDLSPADDSPIRRYGVVLPANSETVNWVDLNSLDYENGGVNYDSFSRGDEASVAIGLVHSCNYRPSVGRRLSQGSTSQLDIIEEEEEEREKMASEKDCGTGLLSRSCHVDGVKKGKQQKELSSKSMSHLRSLSPNAGGRELDASRESGNASRLGESTPSLVESEGPLEDEEKTRERSGSVVIDEALVQLRRRMEDFEKQKNSLQTKREEVNGKCEEEKAQVRLERERVEAEMTAEGNSLEQQLQEILQEDEKLRSSFEREKSVWEMKMLNLDTAEYSDKATQLEKAKDELNDEGAAVEAKKEDVIGLTDSIKKRQSVCSRLRKRLDVLEKTVNTDEAQFCERRRSTEADFDKQKMLLAQRQQRPHPQLIVAKEEIRKLRKRSKTILSNKAEKVKELESLQSDAGDLAKENSQLEVQIRSLQSQLKLIATELRRYEEKYPSLFKIGEKVTSKAIIRHPLPEMKRLTANGLIYELTREKDVT
eukprot:m.126790 g.126790  ORF g.126790 m.126790 type:complete len:699 (+) comp37918_c0_seq5:5377-7473(+)